MRLNYVPSGIALLMLILFDFTTASLAIECKPSVVLEGIQQVTDPISRILVNRGLNTNPDRNCPRIYATVENVEDEWKVEIRDSHNRWSNGTFDNPEAAATFIESWAIGDIGLSLDLPPDMEAEEAKEPVTKESAKERAREDGSHLYFQGPEIAVGLEDESSLWLGGVVGGCKELGALRLGGALRLMGNVWNSNQMDKYDLTRYGIDGIMNVHFPFRMGAAYVSPGFGAGLGWLHTEGETQPIAEDVTGSSWEPFDTFGAIACADLDFSWKIYGGFQTGFGIGFSAYIPPYTHDFQIDGRGLPKEPWGFISGSFLLEYEL